MKLIDELLGFALLVFSVKYLGRYISCSSRPAAHLLTHSRTHSLTSILVSPIPGRGTVSFTPRPHSTSTSTFHIPHPLPLPLPHSPPPQPTKLNPRATLPSYPRPSQSLVPLPISSSSPRPARYNQINSPPPLTLSWSCSFLLSRIRTQTDLT